MRKRRVIVHPELRREFIESRFKPDNSLDAARAAVQARISSHAERVDQIALLVDLGFTVSEAIERIGK